MVEGKKLDAAVDWAFISTPLPGAPQQRGQNVRDSDAISDSRKRPARCQYSHLVFSSLWTVPGIIYVSDRSADSICVTALLFFVMKSEYMPSHRGGSDSTSPVFCVACLYIAAATPAGKALQDWVGATSGCGCGGVAGVRRLARLTGGEVIIRIAAEVQRHHLPRIAQPPLVSSLGHALVQRLRYCAINTLRPWHPQFIWSFANWPFNVLPSKPAKGLWNEPNTVASSIDFQKWSTGGRTKTSIRKLLTSRLTHTRPLRTETCCLTLHPTSLPHVLPSPHPKWQSPNSPSPQPTSPSSHA